jgi:hypothetical protein
MPIKLYSPSNIQELDSDAIGFTDGQGPLDNPSNINTLGSVVAVATSRGGLRVLGSRTLVYTGFNIGSIGTVTGIELELSVTRLSRVQDKIVQLWYQGAPIGLNRANLAANDIQRYGANDDLWDVDTVDFSHPSFGVAINLQPHTQYPSNNLIYLRELKLILHTI